MARLYANENFPLPVVQELRRFSHDVLTTLEAGNAGQAVADEAVLAYAHSHGRTLLTFNRRHFVRLHQLAPAHSGIVVCSFDPNFLSLARRINSELSASAELAGRLIRIDRPST